VTYSFNQLVNNHRVRHAVMTGEKKQFFHMHGFTGVRQLPRQQCATDPQVIESKSTNLLSLYSALAGSIWQAFIGQVPRKRAEGSGGMRRAHSGKRARQPYSADRKTRLVRRWRAGAWYHCFGLALNFW
jgi:hypothetical protein